MHGEEIRGRSLSRNDAAASAASVIGLNISSMDAYQTQELVSAPPAS